MIRHAYLCLVAGGEDEIPSGFREIELLWKGKAKLSMYAYCLSKENLSTNGAVSCACVSWTSAESAVLALSWLNHYSSDPRNEVKSMAVQPLRPEC